MSILLSVTKKYLKNYSGLPNEVWKAIGIHFLESVIVGLFYWLSLYFVNDLNIKVSTAGLIISFYGFGAIFGSYVNGKLCDLVSSHYICAANLLIVSIGYLLLIYLVKVEWLCLDVFILGFSGYGFITSNYFWILEKCNKNENQKLKAINILSAAANCGLSVSGIVVWALVPWGYKNLFWISGVFLFGFAIYVFMKYSSQKNVTVPQIINQKENSKNIYDPTLLYQILLIVFLTGLIIAQLSATYSLYIINIFPQWGILGVTILFTLNSLLVVFFETPIGNFCNKYNKVMLTGLGAFLIGFGMFALTLSSMFSIAVLGCIIYTLGEILFFSMAQVICYEIGRPGSKGNSIGMFRMVYAGSRIVGPFAGGLLYTNISINSVWYISLLIGLFSLGACTLIKKQSFSFSY